ncbi:flagellar hook protein FlgE [Herbaspirillum autotrophicum]|uniref:flagellar hook protein FlgE n=1 Tax=Herbaspirillum autotrophicum TaxID=180195 RepID=UPI00067D6149|nr:flagellar hook protein FlgE [Herbaspirillum autotrophicum]
MSFQQGLSGLNGAAKSLDTIGNNVANASTVGFKQSQAQFADMYANSMNRSGNSPVGIGVAVANVQQAFTQGNVTTTNNPLDIAINGDGFFRMQGSLTDASPLYGRNGQFQLDKNGYIINPSERGAYLTGWPGTVNGGDPVPLQIDTSNIPAVSTTGVKTKLNLDSRPPTVPVVTPFSATNTASYSGSTGVTVYDSLGNTYNVQTYYVKNTVTSTATDTQWDVYATVDGAPYPAFVAPATQAPIGALHFNSSGVLVPATSVIPPLTLTPKLGASFTGPIAMDYTGTTQTGAAFAPVAQSQDGMSPGVLSSFAIGKDGKIIGSYSNGQTKTLGQVLLVNFANPNGLQPLGNNLYTAGPDAGQPLVGVPTTGQFGLLQARAVEDSNVDLTSELVNMIVAQRIYQANSQTIKVQDSVLQTLVSLR